MSDDFETFATRLGRRSGKRYAERRLMHVPFEAAIGEYEKLSDLQLRELIHDLMHEHDRRQTGEECPVIGPIRWTPEIANVRTRA